MDDHEERVRQRAYRIWIEEGCPEGREKLHWDMASELVAIEENYETTLQPASPAGEQSSSGEPVEPIEAVENLGEFPTLTDQGEEQAFPGRRRAAAARTSKSSTP